MLQIVEPIGQDIAFQGMRLAAGSRYVLPSGAVRVMEAAVLDEDRYKLRDLGESVPRYRHPVEASSAFVARAGGIGDVLMLTPLLRWLRAHGCERLTFGCTPQNAAALANNPHVSEVVTLPYPADLVEEHTHHLDFEELFGIGQDDQGGTYDEHPTDLALREAGLEPGDITPEEKRPTFQHHPSSYWVERLRLHFRYIQGHKRVVLHMQDNWVKAWPSAKFLALAEILGALTHQVVVTGLKGAMDPFARVVEHRFLNLVGDLDFAALTTVIKTADLFVCCDGGPMHVAGTLGVPTLALFGPFPSRNLVTYYESVQVLEGTADPGCGAWPCRQHDTGVDLACGTEPQCLTDITTEEVARKAMEVLE